MELEEKLQLTVDMAVRDIANAYAAAYGWESRGAVERAVRGFLGMTLTKAAMDSAATNWTSEGGHPLWTIAADPQVGLDDEALTRAVGKWWDGMDAKRQLEVIMGPAGHHKSEYINNLLQKYRDKPESVLAKDLPDLASVYRSEVEARPAQ